MEGTQAHRVNRAPSDHATRVALFFIVIALSACAHTPPGKMSAYAFIGADKIVGGGETVTERFLRLDESGNIVGTAVSSVLNVLMCPVDFLWTGECGCHGKVWREFETSDRILSCAELEAVDSQL